MAFEVLNSAKSPSPRCLCSTAFAGFFQCYLLDDEVALPFFAFIGLFAGSLQKEDARAKAIEGIRARKKANLNDTFQVESVSIENSLLYLKKRIALGGKNSPFE